MRVGDTAKAIRVSIAAAGIIEHVLPVPVKLPA